MDLLEKHYGKRNFTLYSLFMAVPGTNSCYRKIFVTFSVLLLSFSTIFQVLKFVIDGLTLKLIVELVPTIATTFGSLLYIVYLTFSTQAQFQYENILSVMQNDLRQERTAVENEIKRKFALDAKLFTNIHLGVLLITACGVPLAGFLPYFFDVLMSANNTRQAELLFNGEIFIDLQKCFYYIYVIECCTTMIVGLLTVISENISIIIGQHARGMLAVLGYQLENLSEIRSRDVSNKINEENLLRRRLEMCIKNHQILLQFFLTVAGFYDIPLTIILASSFCTLTMSLVQVTDPELVSMKMMIFMCTCFCQLFFISYMGQTVIDASLRIAQNAYNAKWETFPWKVRKLLAMVILRSSKPCLVIARSIYVLSIENCMSVLQTVLSFFMVVRKAN